MPGISKKIAQQIVDTVKDVCGHDINFIQPDGTILASTNASRVGTYHEIGFQAASSGQAIEVGDNDAFYGTQKGVNLPFSYHGNIVAVVGISGDPEEVRKYAYLAQRITGILLREQEYDARNRNAQAEMDYFVRSLIQGTPINHNYYMDFCHEHGLKETDRFLVILVEISPRYNPANLSMIEQNIMRVFRQTDSPLTTFRYPNEYLLILEEKQYRNWAYLFQGLVEQYGEILHIGVGSVHGLVHQNHSCEEAEIALRAASDGNACVEYDTLDLEILLGVIPQNTRERYLARTLDLLDETDLRMLRTYFDCEGSLKEAADTLFIHKNTLQYHLEKIKRITGYDPRVFREGAVLYLALRLI